MKFSRFFLTTIIFNLSSIIAMENPVANEPLISSLKDLQIRIKLQNANKKESLFVDSISPFDITPTTVTRKNLGSLSNGVISFNNEKLEFDSGDGKKTIVSALHIYPEGKKAEGIALKLAYNRASHNFDFHLDEVKNASLKRITTENITLKQPTKNLIPSLLLALDVDSNNWAASKIKIIQSQIPAPSTASAGKTPSNWKFWKK